jgi:hypothetical protein
VGCGGWDVVESDRFLAEIGFQDQIQNFGCLAAQETRNKPGEANTTGKPLACAPARLTNHDDCFFGYPRSDFGPDRPIGIRQTTQIWHAFGYLANWSFDPLPSFTSS